MMGDASLDDGSFEMQWRAIQLRWDALKEGQEIRDRAQQRRHKRESAVGPTLHHRLPERIVDTLSDPHRPTAPSRLEALQRARRVPASEERHLSDELTEFESLRAAEYLSRLAADDDLVRVLQLSGFDEVTPEWKTFSRALLEYGYGVFAPWFGTGEIVNRMNVRGVYGRSALPTPYSIQPDVEHELAAELLVRGVPSFRRNVLLQGRWNADGGATLKTFFVGHLLFMVPTVFRRWRDSKAPAPVLVPHDHTTTANDRVDLDLTLEDVCRTLPPQTELMFRERAAGLSIAEIADARGVSVSKVKTDMMRARQRLTRLYPEAEQWIS